MTAETQELEKRWGRLGVGTAGLGEDVIGCWSQPHRAYHGVRHLVTALDALEALGGDRLEAVAIWFHDAVWTLPSDPEHARDERRSADLACDRLAGAMPRDEVDEVARLVLVTAEHRPATGDLAGRRVSDADLAMLAVDWPRYARSVTGLRAEAGLGATASAGAWARLRRGQIRELLARPRLYWEAPPTWERAARGNLARELEQLG